MKTILLIISLVILNIGLGATIFYYKKNKTDNQETVTILEKIIFVLTHLIIAVLVTTISLIYYSKCCFIPSTRPTRLPQKGTVDLKFYDVLDEPVYYPVKKTDNSGEINSDPKTREAASAKPDPPSSQTEGILVRKLAAWHEVKLLDDNKKRLLIKSTEIKKVDKLLSKMEFGAIAFNSPSNVNISDFFQIQLLLSLSETIEELKQKIVKGGEKSGATIKVSDRMEAHLTGCMFQITAITPEIQAVSKSQKTEWKWEIHPQKKGRHCLHLTLNALLEIDGNSTPKVIKTFERNITVTITKTQTLIIFIKDSWQWLWATILIPTCGWLWKRKKIAQ